MQILKCEETVVKLENKTTSENEITSCQIRSKDFSNVKKMILLNLALTGILNTLLCIVYK